jgi:AraC family transcriptional regulator of adaptative response / DNA-3-methyladenine glycosylase II
MTDDFETYYRAVASRDTRFDGHFFTAVTSTGIYCRPICPARTPKRENVRFFRVAAAAEAAGFRACRRCRPDRSPESPDWHVRADLTARALRLIADGALDEGGVGAVANRLNVSERHLRRTLVDEIGVGPLALARTRRTQLARTLLESTGLPISDIAFTAGFGSIRQFNDAMRQSFGRAPTELRTLGRNVVDDGSARDGDGALVLRLAHRGALDATELLAWFGARAIPGVETVTDNELRRTVRLPHSPGRVTVRVESGRGGQSVRAAVDHADLRDVAAAVRRCRDMFDLDSDPAAIGEVLSADPALAPLVAARPGVRVPGCADGFELAVRAVVGQQVSVAAARTLLGRIVDRTGKVLEGGEPSRLFPEAADLAEADLDGIGLTTRRAATLHAVAAAVAGGLALDRGADRPAVREALLALPGIGPWTVEYLALRALGDPDAFPAGDLGLQRAARDLGLPHTERALAAYSERWRPWRGYAAMYLWLSEKD